MSIKKAFLGLFTAAFTGILFSGAVFALEPVTPSTERVTVKKEVCGFDWPQEQKYDAQLVSVRKKLRIEPGEKFPIKVFLKNTGTMPWFSNNSTCPGPRILLGTDKERDHAGLFYEEGLDGWYGNNRINMDQLRVKPGEIASFTFFAQAKNESEVYKEYFTPVLKDIQWLDNAGFEMETIIGNGKDTALDLRKKFLYAQASGPVSAIDLTAEKSIHVDLSEQKLHVKLGDKTIREFGVSTGAADTPTPTGETKIILKQEVRIANKAPHYIMPKYMMFRAGGFGFHALPSLGSAELRAKIRSLQAAGKVVPTSLYLNDPFWTEARNHIGRPVSHGCIRILPENADFLYEFTDIGTKVVIER